MKKNIGFLIDLNRDDIFYLTFKNIISEFRNKNVDIKVIDISFSKKINLRQKKILLKYKTLFNLNKFNFYQPKNIYDFEEIFSNEKIVLFYNYILKDLKYLKFNTSLIKLNIKTFYISDLGYNPISFNYVNNSYLKKLNYFRKFRLNYYLFRISMILNLFIKIDIQFEASDYVVKSIKKSFSYKLKNIFKNLDISFYKKIVKINSRHYKDFVSNKYKVDNKYIVFVDGMPFDHADVLTREGSLPARNRTLYYNNLKILLKKLSNKFQKKVIICLHPKYHREKIKKDFSGFKYFMYRTEEFIAKSSHVVILESSSIVQAVILKKKIITIHGSIIGNHGNRRCLAYAKDLGLNKIDIGNINSWNLNKLKFNRKKIDHFYNQYIKKNIISSKNNSAVDQVIKSIFKM